MKNLFFAFAFLIPVLFAFKTPESTDVTCPTPTNVQVSGQSSGTISFDWDDCGCLSTGFTVKYLRQSDGYTSPETTVTSSNYTFSGLTAGTYKFYFRTKCGGETSGAIVIEDLGIN